MNYQKIYDSLIERGKNRTIDGYSERHHILPRCMGGGDEKENLVDLTPEEHFLAHVLLVKLHPEQFKLILAAQMMCSPIRGGGRPRRVLYGWLKRLHSEHMSRQNSGEKNPQFGRVWISNLEDRKSTLIPAMEEIPEGWVKGRYAWTRIERELAKEHALSAKKLAKEKYISELEVLHDQYIVLGWENFVTQTGYKFSQQALTGALKKYIPQFVPQSGIQRIKTEASTKRRSLAASLSAKNRPPVTAETRQKMSDNSAMRNREDVRLNHSRKMRGKPLSSDHKDKIRLAYLGTILVNNGLVCKRILPEEESIYINDGWSRGRKMIKK